MSFINQIINAVHSISPATWHLVWAAVVASGVLQVIKSRVDGLSNKTKATVLTALSAVASAVVYLTQAAQANPTIIGAHTAEVVGLATLAFHWIIDPGTAYFGGLVNDAKAYRAQTTAPAADGSEFAG